MNLTELKNIIQLILWIIRI